MIYYLYVKTHNVTGLKYLGQTSSNPFVYPGSGVYWKHHLKQHSNDVSTELIAAFDNKDDLKVAGLFWSKYWDIVESDEWANLKVEEGEGGFISNIPWNKNKTNVYSNETKQKMSEAKKGKIAHNKGKKATAEAKQHMSEAAKRRASKITHEQYKAIMNNVRQHKKEIVLDAATIF